MSEPLLSVAELHTWFSTEQGVTRAVDGVSFDVHEGEAVGLVGESGCGKTVTALSVLGLFPRPVGRIVEGSSIRFRGEELVGASEARMRRLRGNDISMVFQEPDTSLNPVFPVGEQVAEALRLHRGMGRREALREAERLFSEVGIPDAGRRLHEHPHRLSGGMRQRVMIAMALSCEPALVIADEPTTALDVTVQAQILELLAEERRRRGLAVLLITHDLAVVAEACDRVIVMYAGQVVETGTVTEIFHEPRHPYTRGLLRSLPSVEEATARLEPIPGSVPSPRAWPDGCRFRPRCPYAFERCSTNPDLLASGTAGRAARCWLSTDASPPGSSGGLS